MKVLKVLFVLFCLLAYAWAFSRPVQAQVFQTLYASYPTNSAAEDARPFKALVEGTSPLYADRQMTLKITDVPASQQVTVQETYNTNRGDRLLVLLVTHAGKDGRERMGRFCGTLRVHYPHETFGGLGAGISP
jgi:ABC-type oligopeptide transport system substrate-binding subunit